MRKLLRVYVVEDCPNIRDSLLVFLHIPGQVEIIGLADSEDEAVVAILAEPVDAVIVDLNLRDGSGMAVIEKLRRADLVAQPKIIVFTNHVAPEIKQRALTLGADYFLDKSNEQDRLRATLQALRVR